METGKFLVDIGTRKQKYVKEKYKAIAFPFKEISVPVFRTTLYQLGPT
ncbi:MAG TPA: hypothetical protein VJ599_06200 [Nitrososphaeraceae archaeon]|nr:hypothetical protein [Nitrososphaeraceae archaeon]